MQKFQDLQVAIIGAGRMGTARAKAVQQLGARVIAICDQDHRRAHQLAVLMGASQVVLSEDTLPWDQLDAVFVCTPPVARGPVEEFALREATGLFVEKPIGITAAQMDYLLPLMESQHPVTAVGYMNRHRTSVRAAKQELRSKRVLGVSANWVCGQYGVPWWSVEAESGGPLNEQATHLFDLIRYLVGEVETVAALPNCPSASATSAAISVRMVNGAVGTIVYSCEARDQAIRMQVFTEESCIHLSGWEFDRISSEDPVDPPMRSREQRGTIFGHEVELFLSAVLGENLEFPLCSLRDAIATQRVVDAAKESMVECRPVRVIAS